MNIDDLMNKIRHLDNLTAKWIMRHFYVTFFQITLFVIFMFWFVNMFKVIDISQAENQTLIERALVTQSINMAIIVFIMLLNAFWTLYMFTGIQRLTNLLRDINYTLSNQQRHRDKYNPPRPSSNKD